MRVNYHRAMLAGVGLGSVCATGAVAQTAQETASPEITEVIVSATRRDESIQKVPLAITAVTADALAQRRITDPNDINFVAPNVQRQQQSSLLGAANFFIRGVGTSSFGGGVEPSVSLVIDDVVMGRPEMGVVQMFDVERVEVLRGPQGTLFGMNSSAGLVHIVNARPKMGQVEAKAHVSYGRNDNATNGLDFNTNGVINVPLSANSAFRLSAFSTEQNGPVKNILRPEEDLGMRETGARLQFLWQPNDDLSVLLSGDYAQERGAYNSFYTRRYDAPGGFSEAQNAAVGIVASPHNLKIASNGPTYGRFNVGGALANVTYEMGGGYSLTAIGSLRSYSNHSAFDADEYPISMFDWVEPIFKDEQTSLEVRLTSPADRPFEYQLGAFYMDLSADEDTILCANIETQFSVPPAGSCNLGVHSYLTNERDNAALFGQGTFHATGSLRFTAGGRYTRAKLDHTSNNVLGPALNALIPLGTTRVEALDHDFSYRLSAQYDVASDVMVFVTFARGFKASGVEQSGTAPVDPEISRDYELGIKSSWFDRQLMINANVYYETFDGYQATAFDTSGESFIYRLTNAGEVIAKGVEIDFSARLPQGFSLDGGGSYNDASYQDYAGVACFPLQPPGTSGRNVCLPDGSTDVSGNQLVLAPEWTVTLAANYEREVGQNLKLAANVNYYHRSSFSYDATLDPNMRVPGIGVFGASVSLETADGKWRLSVFGRNLGNEHYPAQVRPDLFNGLTGDSARGGNYWQAFDQSAFRTIGISIDYNY